RSRPESAIEEVWTPAAGVGAQRGDRLAADRHEALLGALSARTQHSFLQVDVRQLESDHLRYAQPACVHELQQGTVAQRGGVGPPWLAQQPGDLVTGENPRQTLGLARAAELGGGIVGDRPFTAKVPVERAQARELARERCRGEGLPRPLRE